MMKYLDPNQSEARDRQLKRYISSGQNMVTESVDKIAAIRADFAQWRQLTTDILRALDEKAGNLPTITEIALSD
jgi:hypothetical protein